MSKKKKKLPIKKINIVLGTLLIVFSLYTLLTTVSMSSVLDSKISEAKEAMIPAKLQLSILLSSCDNCNDLDPIVKAIESSGLNITEKKEISIDDSTEIVAKYGIKKLPAIVLTGELEKAAGLTSQLEQYATSTDGAVVIETLVPPYVDASSKHIKGIVKVKKISTDCKQCRGAEVILNQLQRTGVVIEPDGEINYKEVPELISKYKIKKVPTIILSKDLGEYDNINNAWINFGTVESDGSYIVREVPAPYLDLDADKVVGFVKYISITDKSCPECYNPEQAHKPVLNRMGLFIKEDKNYDITDSRAKELIEKYKITKVPTIVLTGDVEVYNSLVAAWAQVGTVEDDGAYVFRKVEVFKQPYRDLDTGEVVK